MYQDGTIFKGGTPEDSKWNEMPNKLIAELHYNYLGKQIYLKNYEAYNHQVKIGYLAFNPQQMIIAVIIMGLAQGIIKRFVFDLIKNKLFIDEVPLNQEYNNKPTSEWKSGISSKNPTYKII